MCKEVFPTKEVGDFINARYVSLKYELDISDEYGFLERDIKRFPAFLFLNHTGDEVSRLVMGTYDCDEFIENVERVMQPNNRWDAKRERFRTDKSYRAVYLAELESTFMTKEIEKSYLYLLENESMETNYTPQHLNYYKSKFKNIDSPIYKFMMDNRADVESVTGKAVFEIFFTSMADSVLLSIAETGKVKLDELGKELERFSDSELLKTPLYSFVIENLNDISTKNISSLTENAYGQIKSMTTNNRLKIIDFICKLALGPTSRIENKNDIHLLTRFLKKCKKLEIDVGNIKEIDYLIEMIHLY